MKYRDIFIEQLKSLPYFSKAVISQLNKQYGLKDTTVDTYISRALTRRDLIRLKKGLYVPASFHERNTGDISYTFYLANVIRTPSYVSSWTALQYYDLTTEGIASIISMTPKITRTYNNKVGNFVYHSLNQKLFFGSVLIKENFNFFIATPAKALFDLLYLRTRQFRGVRFKMMRGIIDDLRIEIDEMAAKERKVFYKMMKDYFNSHE